MAGLVSRCCGREWIGRIRTPSNGRAPGRKGRLGVLWAVLVVMLAVPIATARAEDPPPPPPPPPPTVPTIAVQVSVSIPAVSVNVQVGGVAVSVSTAPVDVSVSVPNSAQVTTADPATAAPQPTTPKDDPGNCCNDQAKVVAPVDAVAQTSRQARATPPRRSAQPTIRAAAKVAHSRTIAAPRAALPARTPATRQVRQVRGATSERRAKPTTAARSCCASAPAAVAVTAAPTRLALPRAVKLPPDWYQRAEGEPTALAGEPEHASDNRLLLQLGMLAAFLYLACLAGWFSATKPRRRRA